MVIDCCVIILTCLFPPAGVFLVCGIGADLVINICLTILGFLPGHIHAFYLLVQNASKPQQPYYQRVPTTTPAPSNGQHRQYDVYQPKQTVAQPVQNSGKGALENDYKQPQQQQQVGETSQSNPTTKSIDSNPPPPYKS